MPKKQLLSLALLGALTLGGCGSAENADSVAKLQEQIGRIAQQLNETKKQVDGLQEANQRSVRSLEELETTVERLTSAPSPSPLGKASQGDASMASSSGKNSPRSLTEEELASPRTPRQPSEVLATKANSLASSASEEKNLQSEEGSSVTNRETNATVAAVSCTQVWKQLGQGKSTEAAARVLGVSSAAIRACEQKVGRSSGS